MATIVREVLTVLSMKLPIFCGGMSRVGFGISGTFVGTVSFFYSTDGVNFRPLSVRPFASGATVQSTTATGNWEADVGNAVAIMVQVTAYTSGSVIVTLGASIDSSYQDAFLAPTSKFVSQEVAGGSTNVITQAAQTNRAWRLRTLTGAFSVAAGAAVAITITDGASSVLWKSYVPLTAGPWTVTLPPDPNIPGVGGGGVVGTAGNSLVVTLAAPGGSVVSEVNCEFLAA